MRLGHVVLVIAFLAVACTGDANPTTTASTTLESTTTTELSTTTSPTLSTSTTLAATTTTVSNDPWSVDYPLAAESVDDLPTILTDKIGAQEPDPDLSIEGSDDIERWVEEWLDWFSWVNANPGAGIEALEHGVVPQSAFYEVTQTALESDLEDGQRLLGYAFVPNGVTGTFDDFFEQRELLRLVVVASDTIPGYVIDENGAVVAVNEPLGGEDTIRLILRYLEEEGEWILEVLEVVS